MHRFFRPWLLRTAHESKRVAELLAQCRITFLLGDVEKAVCANGKLAGKMAREPAAYAQQPMRSSFPGRSAPPSAELSRSVRSSTCKARQSTTMHGKGRPAAHRPCWAFYGRPLATALIRALLGLY